MNKSNTLGVRRIGISKGFGDFYHTLLRMPWWLFFICFIFFYLLINAFFASIYYFSGDNILNANPESYWDAFFFSFQTSATIGYGYLLPKTILAQMVVMLDTLSGLFFVALATGLAFAKFSRPTSKVLFSKNILVSSLYGKKTLMFRMGNARHSQIIDAKVVVVMVIPEITPEGQSFRRIYDIPLIRSHSPLFSLGWTVMHHIDENSPVNKVSKEQLLSENINFIISITGMDDVFSQNIYDRYIYYGRDITYDKYFANVMGVDSKGGSFIDYRRFHELTDK